MSLITHHLNCGSTCPRGTQLSATFPETVVNHCLLVETSEGLVLIDTGMGRALADNPLPKIGRLRTFLFGIRRDNAEIRSAKSLIEALGYSAKDVRHIIPTHLDFDHCGDLVDFPHAHVHVFKQEKSRALAPKSPMDRNRYLKHTLAHGPIWREYDAAEGEPWYGFETVRDLPGVASDILLVPLFGHTVGHTGVAVRTASGWVLHAGGAYYQREELFGQTSKWSQTVGNRIHDNARRARKNQARLRTLIEDSENIDVFCSHDPSECPCV